MPVSYSYASTTTRNRYRRRWFASPWFYGPLLTGLVVLIAGGILFWQLCGTLRDEAAGYDLSKMEEMESSSVILDRNEKIFGQIYVENRETVPYDQLPRDLINAAVSTEDNKFYQHGGFDLSGMIRAALKNAAAGHVRQGASTITQQLARNSFALKQKTFRRKLVEIFLAQRIEKALGKQKIMELYLNRIYFGGGLYGAEAAARGYFGKPARQMTLGECATLVGLIKSPNRLSPWTDKAASREARNFVLGRMRELGYISAERCTTAQAEELAIGNRQNAQGQNYAVDYIRQQVIAVVGWDRAMSDGFRIFTTIDSELQTVAEKSLRARLAEAEQHPGYEHQTYDQYAAIFRAYRQSAGKNGATAAPAAPEYLQGAVIALDNATGGIVALVGGRDFDHNQFDRALQAKRPPGTAMIPFVYAAAFEKGAYPGTLVEDSALDNRLVMIGGTTGILGEWGSERADDHYEGPLTARYALAKGKNGATVRLGMTAGVDAVSELSKAAGIHSPLRPYPSTFLGSSEITLAELCLAYTIFPNGGWRPAAPHILERIEEKDGTVVWAAPQDRTRETVLKSEVAYEVNSCLEDALKWGTGQAAGAKYNLGKFPAGGKTGTAYDFTDALFAGYDSAITCVTWAGFDKPQRIYRGAFGSELALPIWVDIMNASTKRFPAREFPIPPDLQKVEICYKSGGLATDKCYETVKGENGHEVRRRTTYIELATAAQMPTEPCSVHGDGVARKLVKDLPPAEWPRAALAVDPTQMTPVVVKGPTLLAEVDPYNAVKSTVKPKPAPESGEPGDMPDPSKPVLKAKPVTAKEAAKEEAKSKPVEVRRAEPVGPIDQVPEDTILKAEPPPPLEFGD